MIFKYKSNGISTDAIVADNKKEKNKLKINFRQKEKDKLKNYK